ncbi:MAG: transporter [Sphingobacteriia bacterium]|nr:transporter [Sphingobacteriia bacterium]
MAKLSNLRNTKYKENRDTGFGQQVGQQGTRLILPNGNFNVVKIGIPLLERLSLFHALIKLTWPQFLGMVALVFILINIGFACIYYLIGPAQMGGLMSEKPVSFFLECFFFSCQTFATVGYGRVNPIGLGSGMVAAFEALIGVTSFALITGLLYGRFARPVEKILFSENILISPYREGKAYMFRVVNAYMNIITEARIQVMLSWVEEEGDKKVRKFYALALEREEVNFLVSTWTVVHPLEDSSPLKDISIEELTNRDLEIIILLKGFDDTISQTIHARHSYKYYEVIDNAKFLPSFYNENQKMVIRLDQLNAYEKLG